MAILLWNCNGYRPHLPQLQIYLDSLRRARSLPMLIMLTEMKLPPAYIPSLSGYVCFSRSFRSDSSGCAIFVRKFVPARPWKYNYSSDHVLGIECNLPGVPHPLRVVVAYRQAAEKKAGWERLQADLSAAADDGAPVLIGGDFNAHHPHWSTPDQQQPCYFGRRLLSLCDSLHLEVLNNSLARGVPTHNRGNVLDLFLTNCAHVFSSMTVDDHTDLLSDHYPISLHLPLSPRFPLHIRPRWHTKSPDTNAIEFQVACNDVTPPFFLSALRAAKTGKPDQEIADEIYASIRQSLLFAAATSIPFTRRPRNGKPWWHSHRDQLEAALAEYKRARRAFFRVRTEEKRNVNKERLKRAKQTWEETVAKAKSEWSRLRREALVDPDGAIDWREWRRQTRKAVYSPLSVQGRNGELPRSPEEALDNVGSYLSSVFRPAPTDGMPEHILTHHRRVANAVAALRTKPFSSIPTQEREKDFSLKEVTGELMGLDTNKSYGPDDLHPYFLSKASEIVCKLIWFAFNFFWSRGVVPSLWKQALVVVIYKGEGPKESPSSYRPISLTCILSKVFENLVLSRLADSVELHPSQAGFRPNRSCGDQIFLLAEAARAALQEEKRQRNLPRSQRGACHRSVAFIDFSKAFDRVDHTSLLWKLHMKLGFKPTDPPGRVWRFFDAFLSGRSFCVLAGGYRSQSFPILAGVPQGSVTGPFAFCVLIDDLPDAIEQVGGVCDLFADDVKLSGRSLGQAGDGQLRRSLDILYDWSCMWRLVINLDKSCFIVFTRRRFMPSFSINGEPLNRVRHARYLGVWFSPTLSWSFHAQRVLAKAKASANLVCHVANGVRSPRAVRTLSLAIVRSQISSGFPFWRPSSADRTRLQSCILRPLRRALGLPNSAHSESVLAEFGMSSLQRCWEQYLVAWAGRCTRGFATRPDFREHFPAATKYHDTVMRWVRAEEESEVQQLAETLPAQALTVFKADWKELGCKAKKRSISAIAADDPPTLLPNFTPAMLKRIAVLLSYRDWRSSGKGSLQAFRQDDSPGIAPYLLHDERSTLCLRARLRFSRSHLRSHQYRFGLVDSPVCQECKLGVDETVEHVVLECPKYDGPRRRLSEALSALDLRLSVQIVLGGFEERLKTITTKIYTDTGTFLLSVSELRPL